MGTPITQILVSNYYLPLKETPDSRAGAEEEDEPGILL